MFVVWFLSGLVLIYTSFPHASREDRFLYLQPFSQSDFESIQLLPDSIKGKIELEKQGNKPVYRLYSGRRAQKVYDARSLKLISDFSEEACRTVAADFLGHSISKTEQLTELDQWMPWSYYEPLLPIYKCFGNDPAHTVVYVSSKSGSIVQQTNSNSRWAARLGAIPHWIYFRSLRLKAQLWSTVVIWLAGVGVFVSLTGIIAGFIRLRKRKKQILHGGNHITPYKKFWYKWHHLTGFFFGLFVFTFVLSGLFSMTDLPEWLVPVHSEFSPKKSWNKAVNSGADFQHSPSAIWQALENNAGIRKISWKNSLGKSAYWVYYADFRQPEVYLSTPDSIYKQAPFSLSEVEARAKTISSNTAFSVVAQTEYDNYYQESGMSYHPLPVYRIDWQDAGHNQLFVNPTTGEAIASFNQSEKIHRWLYRGLHTFNLKFLLQNEWLRKALLIFLSLGGLAVSVSGLVLGWNWLKRKFRNNKRKRKTE